MTLTMGHHAETRRTARNFLIFHTIAVRPLINRTLFIVTGEDDTARFDSRRYSNYDSGHLFLYSFDILFLMTLSQHYLHISAYTSPKDPKLEAFLTSRLHRMQRLSILPTWIELSFERSLKFNHSASQPPNDVTGT
jgi:hypothetical protein